ncbi:MAG TPA: hypothetical protein VK172_09245 [Lentimicrobium sp.]|nr:hypothetical protein [Lentimicrobium sp.]
MVTESISSSILSTSSTIDDVHFPNSKGIYGIYLKPGKSIRIRETIPVSSLLYVGISKNLFKRDFKQHFQIGATGSSSVRRSLGALLKDELNLISIPRGGEKDKNRYTKYKFMSADEVKLSRWMEDNLIIGYWCAPNTWKVAELRSAEFDFTVQYKPILDRDPRTKRLNPYAPEIDILTEICKQEAMNFSVG